MLRDLANCSAVRVVFLKEHLEEVIIIIKKKKKTVKDWEALCIFLFASKIQINVELWLEE